MARSVRSRHCHCCRSQRGPLKAELGGSKPLRRATSTPERALTAGSAPGFAHLLHGLPGCCAGLLFAVLVRWKWQVMPQVHLVVQDTADFDDPPFDGPI